MMKRIKIENAENSVTLPLVDPTERILRENSEDYILGKKYDSRSFQGSGHSAEQMFGDVESLDEAFSSLNRK